MKMKRSAVVVLIGVAGLWGCSDDTVYSDATTSTVSGECGPRGCVEGSGGGAGDDRDAPASESPEGDGGAEAPGEPEPPRPDEQEPTPDPVEPTPEPVEPRPDPVEPRPDEETSPHRFRFVLIEDLTERETNGTPGTDVDAVGVTPAGSDEERFATTVVDAVIGEASNNWRDPFEALGPPDSGCEIQGIVSLGGAAAGGYLMVGFATPEGDVLFGEGARVRVYETGPTYCPSRPGWFDDEYQLSVSVSANLDEFIEIGGMSAGQDEVTIP